MEPHTRQPWGGADHGAEDGDGQDGGAVATLMAGLIDYAGLFPPAKLDMPRTVTNYAEYLRSSDAWMLGRLIVPVSRLGEFSAAAARLLPGADGGLREAEPWPISAISDGELEADVDAIFAFNAAHAEPARGLAEVDAIEIKVPEGTLGSERAGAAFIDAALDLLPEALFPFFELPLMPAGGAAGDVDDGRAQGPDLRGMLAALSGAEAGAKIRTGGVTPAAFPHPGRIARFLLDCRAADAPFKATAGLHHAVRSAHGVTYEPGCATAVMHGFLNVFLAAALVMSERGGPTADELIELLEERDGARLGFDPRGGGVLWRGRMISVDAIDQTRERFALSYGSCSFVEPVGELRALGLL